MKVVSVFAKDSTTNYIAIEMQINLLTFIGKSFYIAKVNYNPDSSACAAGT